MGCSRHPRSIKTLEPRTGEELIPSAAGLCPLHHRALLSEIWFTYTNIYPPSSWVRICYSPNFFFFFFFGGLVLSFEIIFLLFFFLFFCSILFQTVLFL